MPRRRRAARASRRPSLPIANLSSPGYAGPLRPARRALGASECCSTSTSRARARAGACDRSGSAPRPAASDLAVEAARDDGLGALGLRGGRLGLSCGSRAAVWRSAPAAVFFSRQPSSASARAGVPRPARARRRSRRSLDQLAEHLAHDRVRQAVGRRVRSAPCRAPPPRARERPNALTSRTTARPSGAETGVGCRGDLETRRRSP